MNWKYVVVAAWTVDVLNTSIIFTIRSVRTHIIRNIVKIPPSMLVYLWSLLNLKNWLLSKALNVRRKFFTIPILPQYRIYIRKISIWIELNFKKRRKFLFWNICFSSSGLHCSIALNIYEYDILYHSFIFFFGGRWNGF